MAHCMTNCDCLSGHFRVTLCLCFKTSPLENEYDSHKNEPAGGEHFHVNAFAGGHRQLRNAFLCVDLPFGRAITSCLCTSLLNGLQVQRISIEWEFYVSKQLQKRMNARGCSKELVSLSLKCSPKLVVCNRCQSSPSLTILVSS